MSLSAAKSVDVLTIIMALLYIAFSLWLIVYLHRLESTGCKCADDVRRPLIMTWLIVSMLIHLAPVFGQKIPLAFTAVAVLPMQALFAVLTVQYVRKLKDKKCACSKSIERDILLVVGAVNLLVICLFVMVSLTILAQLQCMMTR